MGVLKTLRFIHEHPLNRGRSVAAFGRFLRWQLATRLLPYPIALPFVDEFELLAVRGMTGATGNYYCGLEELKDMAFVVHFLRRDDVFYDIGANVGAYSLLAAAAGVRDVRGFEPSSATMNLYSRNIHLNGLADVVHAYRVALGETAGEAKISLNDGTMNHLLPQAEARIASESVPVQRLDDVFSGDAPSFLKIDVEGFEPEVLRGAASTLAHPNLMGMLVEDNGYASRYGDGRFIRDVLTPHGFAQFQYDPLLRTLSPGENPLGQSNVLYLRNAAAATERVKQAPRFQLVNGSI